MAKDLNIRALQTADLDAAAAVSADAFGFSLGDPDLAERWRGRVEYLLRTDPEGAFVAEADGEIIGVAQAMVRERLWCLSLFTVGRGGQDRGAGRALFERTLNYRGDSKAGLIVSSNDPRALRLYGLSGFSLLPTFQAEGQVDRRRLPRPDSSVTEVSTAEIEQLASIARAVRGAPYTSELEFVLGHGARLLRLRDRGFAVAYPGQGLWQLAAHDEEAAAALLWRALALASEEPEGSERPAVRWLTGEQQWAIEICMRAGLALSAYGALCVRGNPGALRPFVPSGPFA